MSSKLESGGIRIVLFAAFVLAATAVKACENSAPSSSTASIPVTNPIQDALRPVNPAPAREGIATVILIDTSGSMQEPVRDVDGNQRPKITIAKHAALNLVDQFVSYSSGHPEQTILLGIYEFSERPKMPSARPIIALGKPDPAAALTAISGIIPAGDTPIGDAMIVAKRNLDATGLSKKHILVITDGENTAGYSPADVTQAIASQSDNDRASIYFVAFDVAAAKFNSVRDAGGLVLAASNETDLKGTLDYLLTGKILAEQPSSRGADKK